MTKHTILFLAANPVGTDRLALDEEARAIHEELERSGHRDRFELVTRWAARPLDLLRELRKLRPTVVHFSGHGDCGELRSGAKPRRDIVDELGAVEGCAVDGNPRHGLFFQGPDGRPQLVSIAALKETFSAAGSAVKLVVLNACYSEGQAEALLAHVGCVVGMSGSIRDDTARNFAIGFYGGLGERESVATAYKQGRAAISLEGLPDSARPHLKVRDGIDAEQFVLAVGGPADASELALPDTEPAVISQVKPSTQVHEYGPPPWIPDTDPLPVEIHVADRLRPRRASTSISDTEPRTMAEVALSQDLRDDIGAPDVIASMSAAEIVSFHFRAEEREHGAIPARYQLGPEIARGGMGRVVDALDTRLGRTVAFKEALAADRDALLRFEREIRITARLEHPSIVPVYDAGESSGGAPFYVMRKVSGRPLAKLVASAETLGQRLALIPHLVDSAQAIAHAHERGIVHRDIKPSNIVVGDLGETVVIDWGLAKVIGEPEPDAQVGRPMVELSDMLKTRAGIVYGTPGFMAPEQLCGAPVDERCDVYALGATLYHLLARTPPHHARTADEMMKAAVAAPPTPIRKLVPGVPLDLSTIVDKALAHDPTVRYQNARSLAEDLQRFLTGQLVASHRYTPREKLIRFVRKNRGLSAAVAALIVLGSVAIVRIYVERDRARRAEVRAEAQRAEAERRAEELTLNQARYNVDVNPTRAVLMVKPLAARYWREVRAIAAAAHAAGVAWSLPAAQETRSLEMSHDGTRAVSAGRDGVVRLHDLVRRTTRPVLELGAPALARFGDGDRQIVASHDRELVIADPATGQRSEVTAQRPITDLEVVGTTAYWVDGTPVLWRLDLAGRTPLALPLDEPLSQLAPSPDGRWIALAGAHHLYFLDRSRPDAPAQEMMLGAIHEMVWSSTGEFLDAVIDDSVISYQVTPTPDLIDRKMIDRKLLGPRLALAHHGARVYVLGATGVVMLGSHDIDRRSITGTPAGLAEARGDTMIAGASDGITVMSEDGDRVLPLTAARVERVVASPRSPYLLAQVEGRLLLWNLDDIQPRRLSDNPTGRALFADPDHAIASGTLDYPTQAIDLTTRAAVPIGEWHLRHGELTDLRSVTSAGPGRAIAIVDGERRGHLVIPGKPPEDLPGEIDFAAFATDTRLVLATLDGQVFVHDLARGVRAPLVERTSPLLGLAWGRGHHAWVAAAFGDGTLWRKNLATGATATAARVPPIDPRRLTARDGKLLVGADGGVVFLHDGEVRTWRADGTLGVLARAPKPLEELGEAGPDHIVAIADDTTIYTIDLTSADLTPADLTPDGRPAGAIREALASIASDSAAMAPDTGMLVAIERGALTILDPLVHQRWTLAPNSGVMFVAPVISADGRRVIAGTPRSLLAWSIDLPDSAEATARWLDAMTNAVDDRTPGGLGWR